MDTSAAVVALSPAENAGAVGVYRGVRLSDSQNVVRPLRPDSRSVSGNRSTMVVPRYSRNGSMALKSHFVDDLLRFASASRSMTAVTLAAVSFAICHYIVMGTANAAVTADLDAEIPLQL